MWKCEAKSNEMWRKLANDSIACQVPGVMATSIWLVNQTILTTYWCIEIFNIGTVCFFFVSYCEEQGFVKKSNTWVHCELVLTQKANRGSCMIHSVAVRAVFDCNPWDALSNPNVHMKRWDSAIKTTGFPLNSKCYSSYSSVFKLRVNINYCGSQAGCIHWSEWRVVGQVYTLNRLKDYVEPEKTLLVHRQLKTALYWWLFDFHCLSVWWNTNTLTSHTLNAKFCRLGYRFVKSDPFFCWLFMFCLCFLLFLFSSE